MYDKITTDVTLNEKRLLAMTATQFGDATFLKTYVSQKDFVITVADADHPVAGTIVFSPKEVSSIVLEGDVSIAAKSDGAQEYLPLFIGYLGGNRIVTKNTRRLDANLYLDFALMTSFGWPNHKYIVSAFATTNLPVAVNLL